MKIYIIIFILFCSLASCGKTNYYHTFKKDFQQHISIIRIYGMRGVGISQKSELRKYKKAKREIGNKNVGTDDFINSLIYLISITQMEAQVQDGGHYYSYDSIIHIEEDVKEWKDWFKKNAKKVNKSLVDSLLTN